MTDEQPTIKEIEELFGRVDWENVLKDEIVAVIKEEENKRLMTTLYGSSFADGVMMYPKVYKTMNRVKFEMSKATEKTFFGRKYATKKIKRRISYEVIWWSAESRLAKCFYSAKKMRKFVNELHSWYNDYIEIEKTFCYREHHPRHKWFYISEKPDTFICVEKY